MDRAKIEDTLMDAVGAPGGVIIEMLNGLSVTGVVEAYHMKGSPSAPEDEFQFRPVDGQSMPLPVDQISSVVRRVSLT